MSENKDDILSEIDKRIEKQVEKAKAILFEEVEASVHGKVKEILEKEIKDRNIIVHSGSGSKTEAYIQAIGRCHRKTYLKIDPNKEYITENNLKDLIKRKGFTQTEVSNLIGISDRTLSNIATGRFNTSLEVALKLSNILQEPVENIFKLTEK